MPCAAPLSLFSAAEATKHVPEPRRDTDGFLLLSPTYHVSQSPGCHFAAIKKAFDFILFAERDS